MGGNAPEPGAGTHSWSLQWKAVVTSVQRAHHPSLWCPCTHWGALTSIPSPTLAERPCEAWFAAANWSVLHRLAVPLVLARVWQAGIPAPLETERNPSPRAMWARQLTCSKGKASKLKRSKNYLPYERCESELAPWREALPSSQGLRSSLRARADKSEEEAAALACLGGCD